MADADSKGRALTRVLSITSGKGGVGKTNVVSNLAYLLSMSGKNVFILDADIGLANIDVMLGLAPEYNLQHVFSGEKTISDIVITGPGGMRILPASSGVQELAELTHDQKMYLLSEFSSLTDDIDYFFIDTGAGISSNVMYFNLAAQEKVVIVTPEPTSITDAYAIMKVMSMKYDIHSFKLIVNECRDEEEATTLYANLSSVAERFLSIAIEYLGHITLDKNVPVSVRNQKVVSEMFPETDASLCYMDIAKKLTHSRPASKPTGNIGFFWNSLLENTT